MQSISRASTREEIFVPNGDHSLHMVRVYQNPQGKPIVLLHGAASNYTTFINKGGDKGLADYLARQGYDVFLLNLRGHGKSFPPIGNTSYFGLKEAIAEDCPALLGRIREIKGNDAQHWIAHSWGGVVLLAYLARYHIGPQVASITLLATRRQSTIVNLKKILLIDILFKRVAWVAGKILGYIPLKTFGMTDNETCKSQQEIVAWLDQPRWEDWVDGFDYAEALRNKPLPPLLSITGAGDSDLGHPQDVQLFLNSIGIAPTSFKQIGIKEGYRKNYDHSTLLTDPQAPNDHFPLILSFLQEHS